MFDRAYEVNKLKNSIINDVRKLFNNKIIKKLDKNK